LQATARLRWRGYEIVGSGRIACVLHCCQKVVLVDWMMEAEEIVAKSCVPGACSHTALGPKFKMHQILTLDIPQAQSQNAAHVAFSTGYGR
jgi:hypothetical protein